MKPLVLMVVVGIALGSCGDDKRPTRVPPPALLGAWTPEVLAHLESACPYTFRTNPVVVICSSMDQDNMLRGFNVAFAGGRIDEIELLMHDSDADLIQLFDRAIAPIVPDDTREALRRSIVEYAETDGFTKFDFHRPSYPTTMIKMWTRRPTKAIRTVKWVVIGGF